MSRLLLTADRVRVAPGSTTAFDLWRLAHEDVAALDARIRLFRHAMIHAGFLLERPAKGEPRRYGVCPVCNARLDPGDDGA